MNYKRNCESNGEILIDQSDSDDGIVLHLNHERHVPHIDFNNLSFPFDSLKYIKTSSLMSKPCYSYVKMYFSMFAVCLVVSQGNSTFGSEKLFSDFARKQFQL